MGSKRSPFPREGKGLGMGGSQGLAAKVVRCADRGFAGDSPPLRGAQGGDAHPAGSPSAHSVRVVAKSAGSWLCMAWPICGNER